MRRTLYDEDHEHFAASVRRFLEREVAPNHAKWEQAGIVDKEMFRAAGAAGFVGMEIPEAYGGAGVADFRFNAVIAEEAARADVVSSVICIALHNDVCLPYFLRATDDEQKARWLPGIASGELLTAVAMTEPAAGSDLAGITTRAVPDGDEYVISGAKTFITNGINADLVIVACRTDPSERHRGLTLFVVEAERDGFRRGRNLEKIGLHAQDTAELFFDDVRVPAANRLGPEGSGFEQLVRNLPRERLSIAVTAVAHARRHFDSTVDYCKERRAFGQPIGSFQHNRIRLAELRTELDIAQVFVDAQIEALNRGELGPEDAAEAKWWCTELQKRVLDTCLQLHGGYGYMEEYSIARAWRDGRVSTIYGGTTEIMKEIIGRALQV